MNRIPLAALILVIAGCNTITRPFTSLRPDYSELPADAMRALALEVEQAVQSGNREPKIADREGIVVSGAQVAQAVRTRAARSELVNEFRTTGYGVEQRNGMLEIRTGGAYKKSNTSKQRDRNALLVMRENQDRWTLYEQILKDSKISPKALGAVQRIFYEARVQTLPAGQKYEDESGNDVVK